MALLFGVVTACSPTHHGSPSPSPSAVPVLQPHLDGARTPDAAAGARWSRMGVWVPVHALGVPQTVSAMISSDAQGVRVLRPAPTGVAVWQADLDCRTGFLSPRDAQVISSQGRRLGMPRLAFPSVQPSDARTLCGGSRPHAVPGGLAAAAASMTSSAPPALVPPRHAPPTAAERASMLAQMRAAMPTRP